MSSNPSDNRCSFVSCLDDLLTAIWLKFTENSCLLPPQELSTSLPFYIIFTSVSFIYSKFVSDGSQKSDVESCAPVCDVYAVMCAKVRRLSGDLESQKVKNAQGHKWIYIYSSQASLLMGLVT